MEPIVTTLGSFSIPCGITVDEKFNVYVTNSGHGAMNMIQTTPEGNINITTIGSGFTNPHGVAVNNKGVIFVADMVVNDIKMLYNVSSKPIVIGTGFQNPMGLVVDNNGIIYASDSINKKVKKLTPNTNPSLPYTITTIGGDNFTEPTSVALDDYGNIYVADYGGNSIKMIDNRTQGIKILGSGFLAPMGVAVDKKGEFVYVADTNNSAIRMINVKTNVTTTILDRGLSKPMDIAVDSNGNLYVADTDNNVVKKITINPDSSATSKYEH